MAVRRRFPGSKQQVGVYFADADHAILEAIADHEQLTFSDIIRRAVRAYAKELGVTPQPPQAA